MDKQQSFLQKFREFDAKGLLIDKVVGPLAYTKDGYVFDRRVFRTYALLLLLIIVYIGATHNVGFNNFYLHCAVDDNPIETQCVNPCYENYDREECAPIVDLETIPRGFTLGTPPDPSFMRAINVLFWCVGIGFVLSCVINHYLHNKGRPISTIFHMEDE